MDILAYIGFAFLYIMIIHFAIGISKEFSLSSIIAIFVIGGIIGYYLRSLEFGFSLAVFITLIFW